MKRRDDPPGPRPLREVIHADPAAFQAYRRWVLQNLSPLFCGVPSAWERFSQLRSRWMPPLHSDAPGAPFSWETRFLALPPGALPGSRAALSRACGVSVGSLRVYEEAGILSRPPRRAGYEPYQIKRLQWIQFLVHEIGIPPAGVSALLAVPGCAGPFDLLVRNSPGPVPVHLSAPFASNPDGECVHCEEKAGNSGLREVRDLLHDLGNKLHVIAGRADRLKRKLADNETADQNLSIIVSQVRIAWETLERLRRLLVRDSTEPTREDRP